MNEMNSVGLMHLLQFVLKATLWLGYDTETLGVDINSGRTMVSILCNTKNIQAVKPFSISLPKMDLTACLPCLCTPMA